MGEIQRSFQRYEKKFLLTPGQYRSLLPVLYARMEEDCYGACTVCNIYYDTPSYELIRTSLDKPVYKEKFRLRSYGVPDDEDNIFAEIKKKCAGIVYKRRVEAHPEEMLAFLRGEKDLSHDMQIQREIHCLLDRYHPAPSVFLAYDRLTLLGVEEDLRITLDSNLRWRKNNLDLRLGEEGEPVLPQEWIIMEIKVPQALPLWLSRLLSASRIYPTAFSKYGTCYQMHILKNVFQNGGNHDAELDYDRSNDSSAAYHLPADGDGTGCADCSCIFV